MNRLVENFANGVRALGIFFILLGVSVFAIAIFVPNLLGMVIAIVLIVGGATRITYALLARNDVGFWLKIVAGLLYSLAGLVLLTGLFQRYFSVSVILGIVLLLEGLLDLVLASKLRRGATRQWLYASSGAAFVVGILFLIRLELGTAWLIGLLGGLCLVTPGGWFLMLAREIKHSNEADPRNRPARRGR